jgi:hypothetical protein
MLLIIGGSVVSHNDHGVILCYHAMQWGLKTPVYSLVGAKKKCYLCCLIIRLKAALWGSSIVVHFPFFQKKRKWA